MGIASATEELNRMFVVLPAAGNGGNNASTVALDVDVDVFLKNVYKYKPPSDVSQQQEYDIEDYCGSSPGFEAFFTLQRR